MLFSKEKAISIPFNQTYKAWNLAVRGEHFDKIPPM